MTCGVYKITNTVTGEFYVGQSPDIEKRWSNHRLCCTGKKVSYDCERLKASVAQYGMDAFMFEVIEECDRAVLRERESYWIGCLEPALNGWTSRNGKPYCEKLEQYLQRRREESRKKKAAKANAA